MDNEIKGEKQEEKNVFMVIATCQQWFPLLEGWKTVEKEGELGKEVSSLLVVAGGVEGEYLRVLTQGLLYSFIVSPIWSRNITRRDIY